MERRGSLAKEGGEDGRLEGGGEASGCAAGDEEASAAEGEGEAQGDSRYIFLFHGPRNLFCVLIPSLCKQSR